MQLNFFNSIELTGPPLVEATEQASKQDDRVFLILKKLGKATPFMVSEIYNRLYPECPVTSIRRSLTVLTTKGELIKCDEMIKEKFGMKNHYWKINH